jgi:hypothetical protein
VTQILLLKLMLLKQKKTEQYGILLQLLLIQNKLFLH